MGWTVNVNLQAIIQTVLLIIFTVTTTLGMLLIASYPTPYQIAVPWQPEQRISIPQQLAIPLIIIAVIAIVLYRRTVKP
ncbi:hypothetical protein DRO59_00215 [Candidatus Bathyarchaeota archaeon]|nr:MAG: hypothetical protein DRO59_00215 [Candidatus Bathyarchaeota archaeon]